MTLSETARERLADVQALQPTTNGELRERWDMESGKDVAAYLRDDLDEYVRRDDNSKICVVESAMADGLQDGAPGDGPEEENDATANDAEGREAGTDTPNRDASSTGGVSPSDGSQGAETRTTSRSASTATTAMPLDRVEEEMQAALEQGYEEGVEHASDAQREPIESESTVEDVDTGATTTSRSGCPECGDRLDTDVAGGTFFGVDGQVTLMEQGDRICESCDVVVGNGGEVIYGTESKNADSTPACSKCGNGTVSAEHALHLIGGYYQQKSALRVLSRRRLKKVAGYIRDRDPEYVCPRCWTAHW